MKKQNKLQYSLVVVSFLVVAVAGYLKIQPFLQSKGFGKVNIESSSSVSAHESEDDESTGSEAFDRLAETEKKIENELSRMKPSERQKILRMVRKLKAGESQESLNSDESNDNEEFEEIQAPKSKKKSTKKAFVEQASAPLIGHTVTSKASAEPERKEPKAVSAEDVEDFLRRTRDGKDNVRNILNF